jgi:peptide/nickel transport system permease protein
MSTLSAKVTPVPRRPPRRRSAFWDSARESRLGTAGLIVLALLVTMSALGGFLTPYDPLGGRAADRLLAPSALHWFGTDEFGRDVFSRIIVGGRNSFIVSVSAVILGTLVGTAFGVVSGYRGGRFDLIAQRFIDMLMAFPLIVLALLLMSSFGPSLMSVIVAIGIGIAPRTARLARAGALSIKQNAYIEAAASIGVPSGRIVLRHVLPNIAAPLITFGTAQVGVAILLESALSFLGAGVPAESPSWGRMLTTAARYVNVAPWLAIVPGLMLCLAVMSVNVVGDALRDLTDPTLLRRAGRAKSDGSGT